jgi:hypothetical protein
MDVDFLFALGAPALLAFGLGYALSRRLGVRFLLLAIPLGPVAFYVLGLGLRELGAFGSDAKESLAHGLDNLELFVVLSVALIGWEVGSVAGAIHRAIGRRTEGL